MELFLNICWSLLVLPAAFALFQRTVARRWLIQVVALVSVLILLFPVISVSDDLQYFRPEIEDAGAAKFQESSVSRQAASHTHLTPFLLAVSTPPPSILELVDLLVAMCQAPGESPSVGTPSSRGPPPAY